MIHVAMQHTTPRTKELAERLRTTIADYKMREAKITTAEINAALDSVRQNQKDETRTAIAIIAGILGLFIAVAIAVSAERERLTEDTPLPAGAYLVAGIIIALAIVVFLRMRSSD
jgi:hypothetical protein